MVYGGTIRTGTYDGQPLDVISAFQAYGQYIQEGQTEEAEKKRYNTIRHSCPGPGACGGVRLIPFLRHTTLLRTRARGDKYSF